MVASAGFCSSVNRHEYICHDNDSTDRMNARTAIASVIQARTSARFSLELKRGAWRVSRRYSRGTSKAERTGQMYAEDRGSCV